MFKKFLCMGSILINGFLCGMDGDALEEHKGKFQGVLWTHRRAETGFPVEEVKGIFGNALSVPISIFYGENFYKEVLPMKEISLYRTDSFTIYIPNRQKSIETGILEQYFYSYLYLNEDDQLTFFSVETLQNIDLGTMPVNIRTNEEHILDHETKAMYAVKLAYMKSCNL